MAPKKNMFRMKCMLAFTPCFLRYRENSPYEVPAAMASMTPFRFLRCARSKTISRPRMLAPSARIFLPVMRSIFIDDSKRNEEQTEQGGSGENLDTADGSHGRRFFRPAAGPRDIDTIRNEQHDAENDRCPVESDAARVEVGGRQLLAQYGDE